MHYTHWVVCMAQESEPSSDSELFQVRMPHSLKEKLRVESAKAGMDMSPYVRQTLRASWNSAPSPSKDPNDNPCHSTPSCDSGASDMGKESDESEDSSKVSGADSGKESNDEVTVDE